MARSLIFEENGAFVVKTPYSKPMVESLKSLPTSERKYDPGRKVWIIEPKHGPLVSSWISVFFGENISLPDIPRSIDQKVHRAFAVRYLGCCRDRADGRSSAYGYVDGNWSILFPETVLRKFFGGSVSVPNDKDNYFALLGIAKSASQDDVAKGYRRMAKLWHPDVCKDDNAHEIFMQIQTAYETLRDTDTRQRYEAGLMFETLMAQPKTKPVLDNEYGYRSPLRSGVIVVYGVQKLNMFEVEEILSWDDIVDRQGRVLVTSWPSGATEPVEEWV